LRVFFERELLGNVVRVYYIEFLYSNM